MDLTKTALITGIAITLYYLLLQWPNDPVEVTEYDQRDIIGNTIIDSNDSLTDTLSPMDDPVIPLEASKVVGPSYKLSLIHI